MPAEVLSESLAAALNRFAYGWFPALCPDRPVARLAVGAFQVHGDHMVVSFPSAAEDDAHITIRMRLPRGQGEVVDPFKWHGAVVASLHDGWQLTAMDGSATSLNQHAVGDDLVVTIKLMLTDWCAWSPGRPQYWVAEVGGDFHPEDGNLVIQFDQGFSASHLRLRGSKWTYFLLRRDSDRRRRLLVIVPDDIGAPLDPLTLNREIGYLDLALSAALGITRITALDSNFAVAGAVFGSHLSPRAADRGEFVVPLLGDPPAAWSVPFFRKLATYKPDDAAGRENLMLAVWWFRASAESTAEQIGYANLSLAAASAARASLDAREAQGDDADDAVGLVKRAMNAAKVEVLPEFDGVFAKMGRCLSAIPMTVTQAERAQLGAITTALLSRVISYAGKITGWTFHGWAHPEDAPGDWWKVGVDDEAEAQQMYVGQVGPRAAANWPRIRVPRVPDSGLLRAIADFAAQLALATDGLVEARLVPSLSDAAVPSFDLNLQAGSGLSAVLFTAKERADGAVEIEGWKDEQILLKSGEEARTFLSELATSPSTAEQLRQLALTRARLEARDG